MTCPLQAQNDILKEEVRQLRKMLAPRTCFPREWSLSPAEGRVLAALYAHPGATINYERVLKAATINEESFSNAIGPVIVCSLRKKVRTYGIVIQTEYKNGYYLTKNSAKIIKKSISLA